MYYDCSYRAGSLRSAPIQQEDRLSRVPSESFVTMCLRASFLQPVMTPFVLENVSRDIQVYKEVIVKQQTLRFQF